ncbi:hypothetical protein ACFY1P_20160 [Streptomyces sp. NPDC001407]|uniref:hypothetical protein n=1 Tax=Streptomyces sp. NPDC001407 TaxID=3364573 RepID=UPI00369A99A0
MTDREWTIDALAHALSPEQRHRFLRDVNLAPLADLPGVLDRWVRHVTQLEQTREQAEDARSHFAAHGSLPSELEPTDAATAAFAELRRRHAAQRGAA